MKTTAFGRNVVLGLGFFTLLAVSGRLISATTVAAGMEQKTVWSGVYSDTQATNGQATYSQFCVGCHSPNLEGGAYEGAPPLKGEKFMESWREENLQTLFTKIITTMPRRNTNKVLTEEETLNLISYLLKMNEFPKGADLTTAALKDVQIELKDGAKPLPNYAKVQVVGCMAPDGDNWTLKNASAPRRNRSAETLSEDDVKAAMSTPLGSMSFRLQNLLLLGAFDPAMHKGHKMIATGVLIRQGNAERLSLTDLKMVDSACATSH